MQVDYLYKWNAVATAARGLLKKTNAAVLEITTEFDIGTLKTQITIEEAEALAGQLMDYVKEVREYAEFIKQSEGEEQK